MDDRQLVARMIAYMEHNLVEPIEAENLAVYSGYSLNRLRQKFFNVMGDTPSGYLRKRRLTEAAKEILGGEKILEVSLKYGYSSQDNFTTAFRSYFGLPPKELYKIDSKYKFFISKLREEFSIMEIANLKQPPFCSTMMGSIQGAADYFDYDYSQAQLFGLSGHAFLINLHEKIDACSPYCWDHKGFYSLLENLGISHTGLYKCYKETALEERALMEKTIKEHLDEGHLGILTFLEHQLISGYDEQGFHFLLPWEGEAKSEIKQLNYGSWEQCLNAEGWGFFDLIKRTEPRGTFEDHLKKALSYALELFRSPALYECKGCRIGYGAYENCIRAVEKEGGNSHGNWWNGMVWKECRHQGARFFEEIRDLKLIPSEPARQVCSSLAGVYDAMADDMDRIKEKELDDRERISLLKECLSLEKEAEAGIQEIVSLL